MEKIKKAVSIKIAKQIDGTCWAYASTTVILKLMKNIIPEDLEYIDENDTCDYQENIVDLNPDRCGLIDYNNIILFKYLYYILTNEFGCDGLIDDKVIESFNWIIRDLLNNKEPLIVNENYPKDRFNSTQYEDIIKLLNNFKLKPITYSLINIRDSLDNKFNEIAKIIDNNLYLLIAIHLGEINSHYNNDFLSYKKGVCDFKNIAYNEETTKGTLNASSKHAMTIVDCEKDKDDKKYFIIKNSWGKEWGNNGLIKLDINTLKLSDFKVFYIKPILPIPDIDITTDINILRGILLIDIDRYRDDYSLFIDKINSKELKINLENFSKSEIIILLQKINQMKKQNKNTSINLKYIGIINVITRYLNTNMGLGKSKKKKKYKYKNKKEQKRTKKNKKEQKKKLIKNNYVIT